MSSSAPAAPTWAASLGTGVTVIPPGSAHAGDDSPGGVLETVVGDLRSGAYSRICAVLQPTQQSKCQATFDSAAASVVASAMPTFKNLSVSYTAVDGSKALVGLVGTICSPDQRPSCVVNRDPAALFASGKTFARLWSAAVASNSSVYSLTPMIKINGTWYGYSANV